MGFDALPLGGTRFFLTLKISMVFFVPGRTLPLSKHDGRIPAPHFLMMSVHFVERQQNSGFEG